MPHKATGARWEKKQSQDARSTNKRANKWGYSSLPHGIPAIDSHLPSVLWHNFPFFDWFVIPVESSRGIEMDRDFSWSQWNEPPKSRVTIGRSVGRPKRQTITMKNTTPLVFLLYPRPPPLSLKAKVDQVLHYHNPAKQLCPRRGWWGNGKRIKELSLLLPIRARFFIEFNELIRVAARLALFSRGPL